ncbi:MAG: hypothetical protein R2734_01890 [Nocardioides sp.]
MHRHTPEMVQNLSRVAETDVRVSFTPLLVPMSREHPRDLLGAGEPRRDCHGGLRPVRAYADEPFVRCCPPASGRRRRPWPAPTVHLQVAVDDAAGRLVAVCAVDNTTKGTAGAAVQCLNLAMGLAEGLGLSTVGLAP